MKTFKYTVKVLGSFIFILVIYGFLNSNWLIVKIGEIKYSSALDVGTPKIEILSFLERKKYYYSEPSLYYKNGSCRPHSDHAFKWNCQHPSYVFSKIDAGFLSITDPSLRVYFLFDENDNLSEYHMAVGRTFL